MVSLTGKCIGDFEVRECVAEEAWCSVYDAFDRANDRPLLIEVWHKTDLATASKKSAFNDLLQSLTELEHPNILTVYAAGISEEDQVAYSVRPYLQGASLETHLQTAWPLEDAVRVVAEVTRALGAAHEQGVVHGDVRPHNILVTEGGWPLVNRFGLAEFFTVNEDAEVWCYWAPERLRDHVVSASGDLYAVALILYEMLSGGHRPFPSFDKDQLLAMQEKGPSRLRKLRGDLPRTIDDVLAKALSYDEKDRYPTASSLALALVESLPADRAIPTKRGSRPRTPPSGLRGQMPIVSESKGSELPAKAKHVGRFVGAAAKWVLGKLVAAAVILLFVFLAVAVGSAFFLSGVLERRLATQEWHFYGWEQGGESVITETHIEEPLQEAVAPYALGALTNLHAAFFVPDAVELRGYFQERPVALLLGIHTDQGVPQVQLRKLNDVPLYLIGGIISDGINAGLKESWADAPVRVTHLSIQDDEIRVALTPAPVH